ncbi:MAG: hypothetical protein ACKESC_01355 [Candidatus Hodgkinia cicadicola]
MFWISNIKSEIINMKVALLKSKLTRMMSMPLGGRPVLLTHSPAILVLLYVLSVLILIPNLLAINTTNSRHMFQFWGLNIARFKVVEIIFPPNI